MPYANRINFNTFTYFDATLLNAGFQVCEPGLPEPTSYLKIVNTSTVPVMISYDGLYGNDVVLAQSTIQVYLPTNAGPGTHKAQLDRGTPVYVKQITTPGKGGYIYVISYYQPVI